MGAVSGNIKVGNRLNPLTSWQALEYITNQTLDRHSVRRAWAPYRSSPVRLGAWRREAVLAVGGFESSTLAEDTDLTFRLRLAGYQTRCDNSALAYTEGPRHSPRPRTASASAGLSACLQALWKHRRQLFQPRHGAFGMLVMPVMWMTQLPMQLFAPVVDLTVVVLALTGGLPLVLHYLALFLLSIWSPRPSPCAWITRT